MTDEEVIKRRLLIDGDGTGDDRRLNLLIKQFLKFCASNESPEVLHQLYDRMIAQLTQCEFAVLKSDLALKMMTQEQQNYEAISETISTCIEQAKLQIEQSKENLVLAKKIRKNRMEYDVLAKVINQQPDRKKTTEQLGALKKELDELEETRRQLQRKLEVRRNEFTVLMRSIQELQSKLDDDCPSSRTNGDKGDDDEKMSLDGYGSPTSLYDICSPVFQLSPESPAVSVAKSNDVKIDAVKK